MIKKLSVLDMAPVDYNTSARQALLNVIDLAQQTEKLGYNRFWITEHHNMNSVASASPEILIGQIAAATKQIRVGSGGIMLPNHSPYKVAENFKALESFYPGRIDLGIGRAAGSDEKTALALRRSPNPMNSDDFKALIDELSSFDGKDDQQFNNIIAMPNDVLLPPLWILGSSVYSAQLAASEGLHYAFAYHFNPNGAQKIVNLYRQVYKELWKREAPPVILAVSIIAADSEDELETQRKVTAVKYLVSTKLLSQDALSDPENAFIASHHQNVAQSYLSTMISSTFDNLSERLNSIANKIDVEEVMITTNQKGFESRLKVYKKAIELINNNSKKRF